MRTSEALAKKIDLRALMGSLDFSDEEIVEATNVQPALFLDAAILRVQKMGRKQKREARLKLLRSQFAKKYRTELKEIGQRVTDKEIEEKLIRNKEVALISEELDMAEREEEFGKLLVEAFRMRGSSLKIRAELVGAEVYVSRRMEGSETELKAIRQKLAEKYPGQVRKEKRREKDYGS